MTTIHNIKKARTEHFCQNCGNVIEAGHPYKWWQHRYKFPIVFCKDCQPKPSDLVASEKYATYLRVKEELEDWAAKIDANVLLDDEAINYTLTLLRESVDALHDLAKKYQNSAYALMEHFTNGSKVISKINDKVEKCNYWADILWACARRIVTETTFDKDWFLGNCKDVFKEALDAAPKFD